MFIKCDFFAIFWNQFLANLHIFGRYTNKNTKKSNNFRLVAVFISPHTTRAGVIHFTTNFLPFLIYNPGFRLFSFTILPLMSYTGDLSSELFISFMPVGST